MGFYEDFLNGLSGLVGEGRRFKDNAALADFCGVQPSYTHRYLKGERGKNLKALGSILDALGADLVFPNSGKPQRGDVPPGVSPFDVENLTAAINAVERGLEETRRRMEPDQKARLVVAVYELFAENAAVEPARIIRLIKAAA